MEGRLLTRHWLRLLVIIVVIAFGLTYVAAVTVTRGKSSTDWSSSSDPARFSGDSSASGAGAQAADLLTADIANQQKVLRVHPDNSAAWAELGSAYVQQARITADPTYYPKADGALRKSMALKAADNFEAMLGLGALANARHDFAAGLSWGRRAERVNRYNVNVYAVLNDALTQLGDYAGASAATQRMLDLHPGVASYTRASYDFEEHGDNVGARFALEKALGLATSPADIAFCRYYLGELSFNEGRPTEAIRQHERGLIADPSYFPLLAGKAKAEAALGRTAAAIKDYTAVISRVPQPQYVLELGELEQSLGHGSAARRQYELLDVEMRLFAANGVTDDLTAAFFAADHGDPARALDHARREWKRRKSVLAADALAWALHVNHRDTEALAYSKMANRLNWRNAIFLFHRAMIEMGVGQRQAARSNLQRALKTNPNFSPLQANTARSILPKLDK